MGLRLSCCNHYLLCLKLFDCYPPQIIHFIPVILLSAVSFFVAFPAQTDKVIRVEADALVADVVRSQRFNVMNLFGRCVSSFSQTVLTQEAVAVHAELPYIPPRLTLVESLSKVSHV